jgi:membrane protein DedA with SNARE-associated domain
MVGAVVGDMVMYGLGRKFGRGLLQRRGYLHSLLSAERERQIEEQFRLHGLKVLFAARFLVGIRTPIYITAGILKVPFRRFIVADMFCAAVVIPLFFGVAYLFSDHVNRLWQLLRRAEIAVSATVVVAAIAAVFVVRYVRKRRAMEQAAQDSVLHDSPVATEREKSVA